MLKWRYGVLNRIIKYETCSVPWISWGSRNNVTRPEKHEYNSLSMGSVNVIMKKNRNGIHIR
jgi:hypothetical protein